MRTDRGASHTVGVDLAAEPSRTGLAVLEWSARGARLVELEVGAADDRIVQAATTAERVGVDCPLGWPEPFTRLLTAHAGARVEPGGSDLAWRRTVTLRTTDEVVHDATGLTPLRVAADRIAHAALRWVMIEARLRTVLPAGTLARDGTGRVVESYPAASLLGWGLPHRRYKRAEHRATRESLVTQLLTAAPWLSLGGHEGLCRAEDDALDALVCALVARAAALGLVQLPAPAQRPAAAVEGWICLPTADLAELAPASG